MELDPGLIRSYYLAGTVRLPAPPPAAGPVKIVAIGWPGQSSWQIFLRTVHNTTWQVRLSRLVALADVRGLYACGFPVGTGSTESTSAAKRWAFYAAPEIVAAVQSIVSAELNGGGPSEAGQTVELSFVDEGVLFVPEAAPVLMNIEAGVTAAESASYCPPLPGHPVPATPGTACHRKIYCDSEPHDAFCY